MRIISSQAEAILESGGIRRTLVKLSPYGVAPVCLWDDVGAISYAGDTYQGAAGRFVVQLPETTADLSPRGGSITFSALDPAIVAIIEGAQWSQRPVRVMRLLAAVDNPQTLYIDNQFSGLMDTMEWTEAADQTPSKLVLKVESVLREFNRDGARTASDADQRDRDPNDGFFAFAANAVTKPSNWGGQPDQVPQQTVQQKSGFGALLDRIF